MNTNLLPQLLSDKSQTGELELFLSTFYSSAAQVAPHKIIHGSDMVVEYNNDNSAIKAIYPTENHSPALLKECLERAPAALSKDNGNTIGRTVLFSQYPVKGYFRYGNEFQILPVPKDAPQPDQLWADHPFLFEYMHLDSPNDRIRMYRRDSKMREWALVLNMIISGGIKHPSGSYHKDWVIVPENEGDIHNIEARYLQSGYWWSVPSVEDCPGFLDPQQYQVLPLVNPEAYYSQYGLQIDPDIGMILPGSITASLKEYQGMSTKMKEKFLRASYWLTVSTATFHISQSSAYIAQINAIESVMPSAKKTGQCEECKRDFRPGPTQIFHDFIEKYAPGVPSKYRKHLYSIRSKYTHGGSLMPDDAESLGFRFTAKRNEASNDFRSASHAVRVALINWLHDNKETTKNRGRNGQ